MDRSLFMQDPKETLKTLEKRHYYIPPYITLAHLFNAPSGWGTESKKLKQYQLQYTVDGEAEYTIERKTYRTIKGDLIYHAPEQLHNVRTNPKKHYVCISIVFHFGSSAFPLSQLIGSENHLGNFADHSIENKLSQLINNFNQPGFSSQFYCQEILLNIISELSKLKQSQSIKNKVHEKNRSKMVLVRNYILKHYNQDINHTKLEEISGFSRNHIITNFRKYFDMTPFEYLISIRIRKAKELAVQTNLSIGEIANQVGYVDVHTFGRMFKKKTGVNLSQFCASLGLVE